MLSRWYSLHIGVRTKPSRGERQRRGHQHRWHCCANANGYADREVAAIPPREDQARRGRAPVRQPRPGVVLHMEHAGVNTDEEGTLVSAIGRDECQWAVVRAEGGCAGRHR